MSVLSSLLNQIVYVPFFAVGLMGQGDQLKGLNVFTDIQHFRWELRRMFYSVTEIRPLFVLVSSLPIAPLAGMRETLGTMLIIFVGCFVK